MNANIERAYEDNCKSAASSRDHWANGFLEEKLSWCCQPTLVCSRPGLCSRQGLFRRTGAGVCAASQWVHVHAAGTDIKVSLETSAMYREWAKKMRARQLEDAQKFVENTVDMVCLTLYEAVGREKGGNAVREASEGGDTASRKRRKLRSLE